jgi:hypothetical protein
VHRKSEVENSLEPSNVSRHEPTMLGKWARGGKHLRYQASVGIQVYWYKSANTDTKSAAVIVQAMFETCLTGYKVSMIWVRLE